MEHNVPERLIETIVDGKVVESHVAPAEEKWVNYDIEFVLDQSKYEEIEDPNDSDEEFEFPTTLEVKKDGWNQNIPWGASGTQIEMYKKVEEMFSEWLNLVFNNDCKERKLRVLVTVEEVK